MGRWIGANGSDSNNPLQAVTIGSTTSPRRSARPTNARLGAAKLAAESASTCRACPTADPNAEVQALAGVPVGGASNEALLRARGMYGLTVDVANRLAPHCTGGGSGVAYPNSSLSNRLQLAATLLSVPVSAHGSSRSRGAASTTTAACSSRHDPQLSVLSRALAAFKADLTARGIEQNVATLVLL